MMPGRQREQKSMTYWLLVEFPLVLAVGVFILGLGSASWADEIEVELRPLANESPASIEFWEVCFRSDVLLHRLTVGAQIPTGYSGTMDWVDCAWNSAAPESCSSAAPSIFATTYTNINPGRSFAEEVEVVGGVDTLFLVLAGDLLANDGALTSAVNLPGDWACLARLRFNPGLDLDPEEEADLPSLVNTWDTNAYSLGYTAACNEPAVKDGALTSCENGTSGSGLSTPASVVSVASGIPDDADLDLRRDFEDNCVYTANADQLDQGGFQTTVADSVGDACQCGEGEDNGVVDEGGIGGNADLTAMLGYLRGEPSLDFDVNRCSIQNPSSCTILDAALLHGAVNGGGAPANACTAFTN